MSTWLHHAPAEVLRALEGLPLHDLNVAGMSDAEARSACDDHFRVWTMTRFVDSQIGSTDSLRSYTNTDPRLELPPSPASGPLPRLFTDDEPLGEIPRNAHLPGILRQPHAHDPLQDAIQEYVASFYPALRDFVLRVPHLSTVPGDDMVWVCPDCGYYFCPLHLGVDEHAYLLGIAPDLEVVDEEIGSVSINASNHPLFLRYFDHFAYLHVEEAHLRDIGILLCYPQPRTANPAPATWYFMHDQPAAARSASTYGGDVERELAQVRQDLDRRENLLRAEFRERLTTKAQRAVSRTLHRLSVSLTLCKRDKRTDRRAWVVGLLSAGRSIIDTGRALVARLRDEEGDAELVAQLGEYYAYRQAYREYCGN